MKLIASRLTIRHLRMVVAIIEEGNLVNAAKRLNLTQSAVTKALQEVEALTRATLFERTNRGVVPTIFGETLAEHGRFIITQLDHAEEHLADLRDGTGGRIAIGTLLSASAELLPDAIARLRRQRPRIVVRIVEGTNDVLIPALRNGEIDLVVGRLSEHRERQDVRQETLMDDFACVVARTGHPLAQRKRLALPDLVDWDWILPPQETSLRRQVDLAFRQQGLEPPAHAVESVSLLTNRGLLVNANYLGVLPIQAARQEAASGILTILPTALGATQRALGITTRASARLSPAARGLAEALREVASELALEALPEG